MNLFIFFLFSSFENKKNLIKYIYFLINFFKKLSYINDYINLYIACPVEGSSNNQSYYWDHFDCWERNGGQMQINSGGFLRSNECGQTDALINWRFNCGYHHGFQQLRNIERLTEVLNVMSKATTDQLFIGRLLGSISAMFLGQN